jgi:hypothetical protein
MPDCAHSFLEGLRNDYAIVDVRPPVEAAPAEPTEEEAPIATQPVVDQMLPAVQQLAARIEALRGTVKWVGVLIVAFLAIIALK